MAIGGFNGATVADLAQFEYVAAGRIHYFLGSSGFQSNGGSQSAQRSPPGSSPTTASTLGGTGHDLTK